MVACAWQREGRNETQHGSTHRADEVVVQLKRGGGKKHQVFCAALILLVMVLLLQPGMAWMLHRLCAHHKKARATSTTIFGRNLGIGKEGD
jgi:hypothetical protein